MHRYTEPIALWDKTRSFWDTKNSLSHEWGSERSERASKRTSKWPSTYNLRLTSLFLLVPDHSGGVRCKMDIDCRGWLEKDWWWRVEVRQGIAGWKNGCWWSIEGYFSPFAFSLVSIFSVLLIEHPSPLDALFLPKHLNEWLMDAVVVIVITVPFTLPSLSSSWEFLCGKINPLWFDTWSHLCTIEPSQLTQILFVYLLNYNSALYALISPLWWHDIIGKIFFARGRNLISLRSWTDIPRGGPDQLRIQNEVLGHSLVHLLVCWIIRWLFFLCVFFYFGP